jgi:hypothetical protein
MNTTLTFAAASEHIADLNRTAERQRASTSAPASRSDQTAVVLRFAQPQDDADITRLAQLDDAPTPVSPIMLAAIDGEPVAALSLSDGRAVANPFVATQKAVTLLRLHAAQAAAERHHRWRPRVLHPRFA